MSVYIVQERFSKRVKIGYTGADVIHRVSSLQTGNPEPLDIIHVYEDAGRIHERILHRMFEKHRLHGEWFEGKGEVWNHIATLKDRQNLRYLDAMRRYFEGRECP